MATTIRPIGSNQTEMHLSNGTVILFSYSTPVAGYIPNRGWFRTDRKYSVTTSRHINQYLAATAGAVHILPQAEIDALTEAQS